MIKLSILILTHCRPKLFERCINSVITQLPEGVEVIVNNDSDDIFALAHSQVTYHYKAMPYLSHIYRFLMQEAKGEHIYYLEDDDYLLDGFFDTIMPLLDNDIIAGNHYPTYNDEFIMRTTTQFKDNDIFETHVGYATSSDSDMMKFVETGSDAETMIETIVNKLKNETVHQS